MKGTWHSKFAEGQSVKRRARPDGTPPPYLFLGVVCGSYTNPQTQENGAVVMSFAERGCIQLFPDYMLVHAHD